MIRKTIIATIACLILGFAVSMTNEGCKPYCDSLPGQSPANLRILNAVCKADILLIYIDGKLFDRAYYNLGDYPKAGLNFGYRSNYISDGSALRAGQHHIVGIASGAGVSGDTVFQSDYTLYNHKQSVIAIGKLNGPDSTKLRTIYLDDIVRNPEVHSAARFIHAVPDLAGLDVFFNTVPTDTPDIRIHYGKISDNQGGDNGTGLSPNDYFQFPATIPGLIVSPVGDPLPGDILTTFPYPLNTSFILLTIVIRGETKPEGDDPSVETIGMEDGEEGAGTYAFEIQSFGVRLINATNVDSLSLLIMRADDKNPRKDYPSAEGALNIPPDSVGGYIPLNPGSNSKSTFYFAKDIDQEPAPAYYGVIDSFVRVDTANERATFIAIDTIANDAGFAGVDTMILNDNYPNSTDPAMGRVRFVDATSDYHPKFTFGGKQFNMNQRNVIFGDTNPGSNSITVTDGAGNTAAIALTVSLATSQTVFFLPSKAGGVIQYRISTP